MTKVVEKVKSCCVSVKENWNENKTAKAVKILCFFIGFFFDVFGVICVTVWKYVFSNLEKSKYCIRMAVLGLITKLIVFAEMFIYFWLPNGFFGNIKTIASEVEEPKIEQIAGSNRKNVFYFDDFFDKEFERMHRAFEERQAIFDEMFYENRKEMDRITKKMDKEFSGKDVQVKKEVKNENGFETKTIEKTSQNGYSQHISIRYVGDDKNNKNSNKKSNSKQEKKTTKDKK